MKEQENYAYVVSYVTKIGAQALMWGVIYTNREARWFATIEEADRAAHVYNIGGAPE